ncbi:MAG: hypothetical protein ACXWVD_00040 [Telluria sp.]
MSNTTIRLDSVVAKMSCHATETTRWGVHDNQLSHKVKLGAVYSNTGENKDFADATPSGECWMNINDGRPAAQFFKPGKKYYVTFTEAPD